MTERMEITIVETYEVVKKIIAVTDEDTENKNLGYIDGEDLNEDVEGYNVKTIHVVSETEPELMNKKMIWMQEEIPVSNDCDVTEDEE